MVSMKCSVKMYFFWQTQAQHHFTTWCCPHPLEAHNVSQIPQLNFMTKNHKSGHGRRKKGTKD